MMNPYTFGHTLISLCGRHAIFLLLCQAKHLQVINGDRVDQQSSLLVGLSYACTSPRATSYILSEERLYPVVVDEKVGLLLDVIIQSQVEFRVHVAYDWDLNGLILDLLLASAHGLDDLCTALVTTHTVRNVVQMHCGSECARAIILGTSLALFARVLCCPDFVARLSVQEAVVTALAADSGGGGKADCTISMKLEYLHWHL